MHEHFFKLIDRAFYKRDTVLVARELLGCYLIRIFNNEILIGMIVETEAYPSNDPASHAFSKKTQRNRSLYGPVGHAYVYFLHNNYCLNVVAHDEHIPAGGVLIRAIEPIGGIAYMKKRRHVEKEVNLTNGPGKLAKAMAIDIQLDGVDVTKKGELMLAYGLKVPEYAIKATRRIGITKWPHRLRRFIIKNNRWISR